MQPQAERGADPVQVPEPLEQKDDFPIAPPLEMSGAVKDEIGRLVQSVFLGPQGARHVVFAGPEPGCGSTWTCAHATDLLASACGKVCVVDCNMRAPGLHLQFGIENHHGLSDALRCSDPMQNYAKRLSRNLWLLSCGSDPENGQTMLGSEQMRSRLAELRSAFDYVLIDSAPMNVSRDAIVLGGFTDGVVLVLKAHSSRRETARTAVQDLAAANVRTLGAVLNQRTFPIPEKLYRRL